MRSNLWKIIIEVSKTIYLFTDCLVFFWSRDKCLYLGFTVADVSRCNDFIANIVLLAETDDA